MKGLLIAYPQDITFATAYASPTGEFVLDLYKDEPIPFQFKIDDFTNVAEKSSSNSKSFEIPGTKNNNVFFNHIYEITSDSGFNPHKKTKIIYKEDGIDVFNGYLQLNDIVIKNNNVSYEITLFSETINLKESIENKTLKDIDFSELTHNYNESNITKSITGILEVINNFAADSFAGTAGTNITSVIKYPLCRWNGNFSSSGSIINIDNLRDAFRPWLNCKYILQRILANAGFTYTSNFIDSSAFNKLYMDINKNVDYNNGFSSTFILNTPDSITYSSTFQNVDFTNIVNGTNIVGSAYYDTSTNIFTAPFDGTQVLVNIQLDITGTSGSATATLELHHNNTTYNTNPSSPQTLFNSPVSNNSQIIAYSNIITLNTGETLEFKLKKSGTSLTLGTNSNIIFYTNLATTSVDLQMQGERGDLNQWAFVKGFIDKFNLLVMSSDDNPNNLIIEPYNDYIDSGDTLDWTSKIDDNEIKFTPIDGLSEKVSFNHDKDSGDRITSIQNNPDEWKYNHEFTPDIEITDKKIDKILVKDFASTAINAVVPWGGELVTPYIIAPDYPENWNNKARILYDCGLNQLVNTGYSVGSYSDEKDYLLFSPTDSFPISSTTKSLDFGVVNYGIGGPQVLNSLYYEYWDKYIDELYHKDTRIAKVKAYITAKDLNEFSFKDIIMIKNRKYRVKMIDYKADSLSILELITIKDL